MSETSKPTFESPKSIWDDPNLTAYVVDELTGQEKTTWEARMASEPEVAAAVSEMRALLGQLEKHFATEQVPVLDAKRQSEIVEASKPVLFSPQSGPSRKLWLSFAVIAAALMLMIGIFQWNQPSWLLARLETAKEQVAPEHSAPAPANQSANLEVAMGAALADATAEQVDPTAAMPQTKQMETPKSLPAQSKTLSKTDSLASNLGIEPSVPAPGAVSDPTADVKPVHEFKMKISRKMKERGLEEMGEAEPFDSGPVATSDIKREKVNKSETRLDAAAKGLIDLESASIDESTIDGIEMIAGTMRGGWALQESAPTPIEIHRNEQGVERLLEELDTVRARTDGRGEGAEKSGDKFDAIVDNDFKLVTEEPLSTFSIDVDTASYSKIRSYLDANRIPRPDMVRIEEMINYFSYDYTPPPNDGPHPLVADVAMSNCPWNSEHQLARIAVVGKSMKSEKRPPCNLVFLIDTSGSMSDANKLSLVIEGLRMLTNNLNNQDRVAIVAYANASGLVLDSTSADRKDKILESLSRLSSGGSTNGGDGIRLAYNTCRDHFIPGGVNRVILCSDGDFNVGTTSTDELIELVQREAKDQMFLTVLGFGMGNHNDSMMEQISGRGNGNYAFIDTEREASKVLVNQINETLVTIAKDVKLQLEFNPKWVQAYRLIGYENRVLAKEDFNDDKKDAGDIGAGHQVTALYEIIPAGSSVKLDRPRVNELKFQSAGGLTPSADSDVVLNLSLRYKLPDEEVSKLVEFTAKKSDKSFNDSDVSLRWAAAIAGFGMNLRQSPHAGKWTLDDVIETAKSALGEDGDGLRREFIESAEKLQRLRAGRQ